VERSPLKARQLEWANSSRGEIGEHRRAVTELKARSSQPVRSVFSPSNQFRGTLSPRIVSKIEWKVESRQMLVGTNNPLEKKGAREGGAERERERWKGHARRIYQ